MSAATETKDIYTIIALGIISLLILSLLVSLRQFFLAWIFLVIILAFVILKIIFRVIAIYNEFYRLKNAAEATVGQVRVAMKLRLDTIEQLLLLVKSYSDFEQSTFTRVTEMRATVSTADLDNLNTLEMDSRLLLGRLFAVAENYPDLKASAPVLHLMTNISTIEKEIASHRYTYNNIVREFNTLLDIVPQKFVGKIWRISKLDYLQFGDAINIIPKL